ncbi:putative Histidine kinase [Azospirillaceae bacterium]
MTQIINNHKNKTIPQRIAFGFFIVLLCSTLSGFCAVLYFSTSETPIPTPAPKITASSRQLFNIEPELRAFDVAARDALLRSTHETFNESEDQAKPHRLFIESLKTHRDIPPAEIDPLEKKAFEYWSAFEMAIRLRIEQQQLSEQIFQPLGQQIRLSLQRFIDRGGEASELSRDIVQSILLMQTHIDRYRERHDIPDMEQARADIVFARNRIAEFERIAMMSYDRNLISDTQVSLTTFVSALARIETITREEETLLKEIIPIKQKDLSTTANRLVERLQTQDTNSHQDAKPESSPPIAPPATRPKLLLIFSILLGACAILFGMIFTRLTTQAVTQKALVLSENQPSPFWKNDAPPEQQTPSAPTTEQKNKTSLSTFTEQQIEPNHVSFLVNAGQQLRAPLSEMIAHSQHVMNELERLNLKQLTPEIEMILWSTEQILTMTDSVQELARIETGTLLPTIETFDVGHLLVEVRERLRSAAELYGNHLTIACAADVGTMKSDFKIIRSTLLHLLDNACKYTHDGKVSLEAEKCVIDDKDSVCFTVSDTGIGMSDEEMHKMFKPFVRGRSSDDPTHAQPFGTGLGLTLVQHYCTLLEGHMEVSSTRGRGSRFAVTFPTFF